LRDGNRTHAKQSQSGYGGQRETELLDFHRMALLLLLDIAILAPHAPRAQGLLATRWYHRHIEEPPADTLWTALETDSLAKIVRQT
jgi:hypothetical protein